MDSPRVILRYRNFNVETIEEHRSVLALYGRVLWGWWRKQFEPDPVTFIEELSQDCPFSVFLIDTEEETQHRASVSRVLSTPTKSDGQTIPSYYRDRVNRIRHWFELTSIDDHPYDRELALQLGVPTFYRLQLDPSRQHYEAVSFDKSTNPARRKVGKKAALMPITALGPKASVGRVLRGHRVIKPVVVQLSDIHLGVAHNFLPPGKVRNSDGRATLTDRLLEDLEILRLQNEVGALILSGDITTAHDWTSETAAQALTLVQTLRESLKLSTDQVLIAPGNHDFKRYVPDSVTAAELSTDLAVSFEHEEKFRLFLHRSLGIVVDAPLSFARTFSCGAFDIKIGILNSCRITSSSFTEYGYVGPSGIRVIRELAAPSSRKSIRIAVLHHHVLPVTSVQVPNENAVSLTLDASDVISEAQRSGVSLVLHGHQHEPQVSKASRAYVGASGWGGLDDGVYVIASGSAGSQSVRPSFGNLYTILDLRSDAPEVIMRRLDPRGDPQLDYLRMMLPIAPR